MTLSVKCGKNFLVANLMTAKRSSVFGDLRSISLKSFGAVAVFMTLLWLLVSCAAVVKLIEERRGAFEAIVESHQEAIVSGQYRPFVEGLKRTSGGAYAHLQICWSSERGPCESIETIAREKKWTPSLPIQVALTTGPQVLATVKASVSLGSAIELSFIILISFILTGISVIWAMKTFVTREAELRQKLATSVLATLENNTTQEIENLPTEIRPIASALLDSVTRIQALRVASAMHEAMGQITSQVAHDIRSPLAALSMAEKYFSMLPEETRLMVRSAVGRIRDIANQLIEKNNISNKAGTLFEMHGNQNEEASIQLLSALIEEILTEKRVQYRQNIGIEIDAGMSSSSYGLFVCIQPTEFKRVLSNLINNSVEALNGQGAVTVTLSAKAKNHVEIKIQDNGKGIPPEILEKLGNRGETHGKEGGLGLGLYHARTSVESWGGTLVLKSEIKLGTAVSITLPEAATPAWFVAELQLLPDSNVVVLDDDESIHRIWQGRADSSRLGEKGIKLAHLSTPTELRVWVSDASKLKNETQFLLDYELIGFTETGLDLIKELGIANQSILVTSRFEEPAIRERCIKLHVPLIPKGMAGFVPIKIVENSKNLNAILIDDDLLIHTFWSMAAKSADVKLSCFKTFEEFKSVCAEFLKETPIYIDSSLGDGVKGETLIPELMELGFKEIYLATGYPASHFANNPTLKIVGKQPPSSWSKFSV